MSDNKFRLMQLINEYYGRRTHFYKDENFYAFCQMAQENYGIETNIEEIKECYYLFLDALIHSDHYFVE